MEETLEAHIAAHGCRLPLVAFIAGRFADQMPSVRFGHAAAIVEGQRGSPAAKIEALREAGDLHAGRLADLPRLVREAIG